MFQANDAVVALFSFGGARSSFMAEQLFTLGDRQMYLGTLYSIYPPNAGCTDTSGRTMILHAIPAVQPGVSPAVEAARAALRLTPDASQSCTNNYFWLIYCHWCVHFECASFNGLRFYARTLI